MADAELINFHVKLSEKSVQFKVKPYVPLRQADPHCAPLCSAPSRK